MDKKVPMRQCVGCAQMREKRDMMRVIKTPEDTIELDMTGRKNGRGAYLCKSKECLEAALKKRGIEKSLHVSIPDTVVKSLQEAYENAAE